jgi:hypothetical protein
MPSQVLEADVQGILGRHRPWYEIHPYSVMSARRVPSGPPVDRKIQAGFDVDVYGTLDKMKLPIFESEEGRKVVDYFRTVAQEIQSKIEKQGTTIEVITSEDSLVLDTRQHFQPEAMLRIRISHTRGLDQPGGPSEEQALNLIRKILHELEVKQA